MRVRARLAFCSLQKARWSGQAAFWHARAGGASVALYLCVFATSLVGNFQQLALNPWAAETGRATRIVELMAGGNAGALLPAFLALLQRVDLGQ